MKRLSGRGVVSVLIGFLLLGSEVWAQSTAQISGTVKDQTGAVVPGVEVTVTQTDTGVKRSVTTDASGSYHTGEPADRSVSIGSGVGELSHLRANRNRSAGCG